MSSSRSISPSGRTKPKRVSEAQRQMQARMAEYQKKREQRVQEKEKLEEEKRKAQEERRKKREAEEEERRNRYRSRSRTPTRSDDPRMKKAEEEREKQRVERAKLAEKRKADEAKKRAEEEEAAQKKAEEDAAAAKKEAAKKKKQAAAAQEQAKKKAAEEKAAEEASKKAEEEANNRKTVAEKALENKVAEQQAQKQAAHAEQQAQKTAQAARMNKWKENEKKRQEKAAQKGETPVERVPKLSAMLAMGGPEAEEYKKKAATAKLANWKSNAGDRWVILEQTFDGRSISEVTQDQEITDMSLEEAVLTFQNNPEKYVAMHYWPDQPDRFTFILRAGTFGYKPLDIKTDGSGRLVIWRHMYKRLEPLGNNLLPPSSRDRYTDAMTFGGKPLHSAQNKPLLPGRGMGVGDEANMELMGDYAQPDHVRQGACVGDCWLLSAIACLADFDWAVQRLFRKNKTSVRDCPKDHPPNQYTVTLWDLKTWKEVDVIVDERLPVRADGTGFLLGAKPSKDGKFWVPYLEKAIAAHCGGYDKICGGNCTDAWPMMTGSRNQFMITKNPKTGKYQCNAKYNPQKQAWSKHSNSPHDSNTANWRVDWPKVGGGGDSTLELTEEQLYDRVITWDENNYLIGAGTSGASDKQSTDGIVDNHAYSVIDSRQNICGTGIDLLLIRNPWGEGGELKNGQFMRSAPGWDKYPAIRKELNPTTEDNGLCWVTKKEFFKYFPTIYVCAFNMTRLKDGSYVNDLKDHFVRRPKSSPKAVKKPAPSQDEYAPIYVNKESDPNSPYKIVEESYSGGVAFCEMNKKAIRGTCIADGVDEFRANPEKYLAIHYQNDMVEKCAPIEMHQYTFIYREGTEGLEIDANPKGNRTMLTNVLR